MKKRYIYDLETYPNFFLATFKEVGKDNWFEFEISDRVNQTFELRKFLLSGILTIGFNNLNFDYPVLHKTILSNNYKWTANEIFNIVEIVINAKYSSIFDNDVKVPQLDLFKIWHYDNKNKSTSLKWLEFAMRMENIEDLPYAPGTYLNSKEMDHVISYCRNDIDATERFFYKSSKHIQIRQFYSKLENMNLINASEIKMSKEIFGKYLAKDMGIPLRHLRKMRTNRSRFNVEEVIFPYIKFNDPVNQKTLQTFKNFDWIDTSKMSKEQKKKHSIKFSVSYRNVVREYAEGGLHSVGKAGIYESNDEFAVIDVDFASYYPHLSFRNKLHPAHIPEKLFSEKYEGFYIERKKYPKKDPRNYVLKIILNGSYGLSKDIHSFLYDPMWQMAICVNGQLLLTLLTEKIFEKVSVGKILFENTDGAAYQIRREEVKYIEEACKEVEEICNIPLEIQECEKIIIRDVNNYINVINNKNVKYKGAYEIDRDYHKNHSKRIVALATAEFFINKTDPKEFIKNYLKENTTRLIKEWDYDNDKPIFYKTYGIYDFCIGNKSKANNTLYKRTYSNSEIKDEKLGKVNRYFVSKEGCSLIKILPPLDKSFITETEKQKTINPNQINMFDFIEDEFKVDPKDREECIEAGFQCTLFNIFEEKKDYNINYDYYLEEVNKLIRPIIN